MSVRIIQIVKRKLPLPKKAFPWLTGQAVTVDNLGWLRKRKVEESTQEEEPKRRPFPFTAVQVVSPDSLGWVRRKAIQEQWEEEYPQRRPFPYSIAPNYLGWVRPKPPELDLPQEESFRRRQVLPTGIVDQLPWRRQRYVQSEEATEEVGRKASRTPLLPDALGWMRNRRQPEESAVEEPKRAVNPGMFLPRVVLEVLGWNRRVILEPGQEELIPVRLRTAFLFHIQPAPPTGQLLLRQQEWYRAGQ